MKISVVTVLLNSRNTIAHAIASVKAQDHSLYEHIIVDGGSTDGSVEVITQKQHDKMTVVSGPDRGIYDAMNKGVRLATGDLIGFLNSDDYFCRIDSLSTIAEAARINSHASAISGAVAIVDAAPPRRLLRLYDAENFRRWMLRFGHMPPHPGFYVRRAAFESVGPFSTDYRIASDFEWMVRFHLLHHHLSASIPQILVAMRSCGISTRGLSSMRVINSEVLRALSTHRIKTHRALIWSKYLAKISQKFSDSDHFPPPHNVAWSPR